MKEKYENRQGREMTNGEHGTEKGRGFKQIPDPGLIFIGNSLMMNHLYSNAAQPY